MRASAALPKTDLHVHCQGSARAETVRELADRNHVPLPSSLAAGRYAFTDFGEFLVQYSFVCASLQTPDDVRRVAVELCEDEAASGVRYAEVTLTLQGYGDAGEAIVAAVLDGFAEGEARTGLQARLVIDVVRGFPLDLVRPTVDTAIRFAGEGVVALGLGGDEQHPPEPYGALFREAIDAGLKSGPHAGEAAGPASIRDLIDAGLSVTLNSDDPAMFEVSLLDEYESARALGFDDADLAAIARHGVQAAFLDPSARVALVDEITDWLAESPDPTQEPSR